MAQQNFAAIRAAALDGRAQNVFYRQTQLEKLHLRLVRDASAIHDAIVADSGTTSAEAKIEYSLALDTLRARYTEIDSKKELEDEYRIANGQNAEDSRTGAGLVVIQPTSFTLFYSVIAPLSAAMAAGNCAIVQLENNTREVPSILKKVIREALDPDAFNVCSGPIKDQELLDSAITVSQSGEGKQSQNLVSSQPSNLVIAVVDRSADFDKTAQELLNARFSFRGRSPYAPDLVLVNEYVKKDFLQALVRQVISSGHKVAQNGQLEGRRARDNGLKTIVAEVQRIHNDDARIVTEDSNGAILDIQSRSAKLLEKKIFEPTLIVHGIKSLDDGIDFLTNTNTTFGAAYHFGEPSVGKYLSQFVPAHVSFVNHIPSDILVGPTFPLSHPIDPQTRYPTTLFSKPTPAYITSTNSQAATLAETKITTSDSARAAAVQKLYASATADLRKKKGPKQFSAAFGFFEQAFVLHFGLIVVGTLGSLVGGALWLRSGRGLRLGR